MSNLFFNETTQILSENGSLEGLGYRFYHASCMCMSQCSNASIALTVTSPPYWNSIDYDIHTSEGAEAWHREREYKGFGNSFVDYLNNLAKAFLEVHRVTMEGGFCAIVIGTILRKGKHYPVPMLISKILIDSGWEFHQDIIWNKVTGGVKRAGSFIQNPKAGYFYPNIMTEYILIFRKPGAVRRGTRQELEIDELFTRDIANNVWHIAPVPPKTIDHPCPYPEELVRRLVLLYSKEEDEILDPFLGSGQTAVVALREGRRCVGYDIEISYLRMAEQALKEGRGNTRKHNLLPRWEKVEVKRPDRLSKGGFSQLRFQLPPRSIF